MRNLHPFLIHSRYPQPNLVAHRGFSARHPENTMIAFEAAIELGYEYLETDVHVTRDGYVVVFHDDTLERMTGSHGKIEELTLSEVSQLRVSDKEPIPLLAELFESFPHIKVNIDPKTDQVVEPLRCLLDTMNVWDKVCIGSFSQKRLNFLREEVGHRLCTSAGPSETARLWLRRFGLPLGKMGANCMQVPPRHYGIPVVDSNFVNAAHEHGLPVYVWTINTIAEIKTLLACGVDGIMSDETQLVMRYFETHIWQTDANTL